MSIYPLQTHKESGIKINIQAFLSIIISYLVIERKRLKVKGKKIEVIRNHKTQLNYKEDLLKEAHEETAPVKDYVNTKNIC